MKFETFFENRNYYNDILHPSFWDGDIFKENVRKPILKIVEDFLKDDKFVKENLIEDIQLTGSLANYNYNKYSDLDIHILLDFKDINEDEKLVKQALDGKRFIWNLKHDINFNGHEVELYFQDIHEPHTASGLYSLKSNNWIKKPIKDKPEVDHRDVVKKTNEFILDIRTLQDALKQANDEKEYSLINKRSKKLKDKLQKDRKEGLASKGEFSIENLAFKNLRNDNYIEKLNDLIIQSYDLMYSTEVIGERKGLDKWFKERWVNIGAPKKGGKYQPCGRSDASKGKYPKCVPAKKAYSMSKKEKKSATTRKRKAENKPRKNKKPHYTKTDK